MQETLYQTADARVSPSDSECRRLSIRQRLLETLYQTADAGVSLSDSGCRRHSIRERMQETLYQTADARYLIERLRHKLSDRDTPASAV